MKIGKDFKYKLLKNFLTKEEVSLLRDYTILTFRHNEKYFVPTKVNEDSGVPNLSIVADPIMESLMLQKRLIVEKDNLITKQYAELADLQQKLDKQLDKELAKGIADK